MSKELERPELRSFARQSDQNKDWEDRIKPRLSWLQIIGRIVLGLFLLAAAFIMLGMQ